MCFSFEEYGFTFPVAFRLRLVGVYRAVLFTIRCKMGEEKSKLSFCCGESTIGVLATGR